MTPPAEHASGFSTREMVDMFNEGRSDERERVASWLERYGYREIATRIRAGEHRK